MNKLVFLELWIDFIFNINFLMEIYCKVFDKFVNNMKISNALNLKSN